MLRTTRRQLSFILSLLSGATLVGIATLAVVQVVLRYVFSNSLFWIDEVTVLALTWLFAFGVPWLWLLRAHLQMDVLDGLLGHQGLAILLRSIDVLAAVLGAGGIYAGWIAYNYNSGFVMSLLGYDESIKYIPVIVASAGLLVAALLNLLDPDGVRVNDKLAEELGEI